MLADGIMPEEFIALLMPPAKKEKMTIRYGYLEEMPVIARP